MKVQFGDTNSKDIWNNHLLCAQFLRNYSGISLLEDVQPEDITDETESLRPFVGTEIEGDAIKKVRVHNSGEQPVYVVALLEHKSKVDYDVTMQLLKYMVGIWVQYRDERNKEHSDISATKGFRYPLVISIVYYEGKQSWTAAMRWGERVEFGEAFPEYVPDFTYQVISLNGYSREEINDCVRNMEDRDMGELWANMDKMDIQAERRNTREAREQLEKKEQELEEAIKTIAEKDQIIAALEAKIAFGKNKSV